MLGNLCSALRLYMYSVRRRETLVEPVVFVVDGTSGPNRSAGPTAVRPGATELDGSGENEQSANDKW